MAIDIYNGKNPLDMPLYSYAEASRYLGVPASTIKSWSAGRSTRTRFYEPLIEKSGDDTLPLSFHNLVELHFLSALRKIHNVQSVNIRKALDNSKIYLDKPRILLSEDLYTFGGDMFIKHLNDVVNLTKGAQIVLKDILEHYLQRVERDESRLPIKLYPIVEGIGRNESPISIDPKVSFGRPVVKNTGISTRVIASRINSGESIQDLAEDYELAENIIREVLYYEQAA